jgi:hypothetical protein
MKKEACGADKNLQNPLALPVSRKPWTLKHYHLQKMGGFVVQKDPTDPRAIESFHPEDLLQFIKDGRVAMPNLDDKDIDDRSKASWFIKGISLTQACWFLLQLLGRVHDRLPITTLELYTLGIVICGIIMYGSYWHKPFDVQRPVPLQALEVDTELEEHADLIWHGRVHIFGSVNGDLRISDGLALAGVCIIFAGSHLIGWNFHFTTSVELWLWRICSICCLVLPLTLACSMLATESSWSLVFVLLCGCSYILVRLALFVEIFVGLRSVPAGVYQTPKWSNYIPSFG